MWNRALILVALAGMVGCSSEDWNWGRRSQADDYSRARTASYRDDTTYRTDTYSTRTGDMYHDPDYLRDVGPGSDNSADYRPGERVYRNDGRFTYRTDVNVIRTDTVDRTNFDSSQVGPGSGKSADQARTAGARGEVQIGRTDTTFSTGQPGAVLSDREFVNMAASSGLFEIESSRLALLKSQDAQVKQVAQKMIDDHTRASDQLKAIASRKAIDVPKEMLPQHRALLDRLRKLSGGEFDGVFHEVQMNAHQDAISLFDRAARELSDSDLKKFASDTLPTLREHKNMISSHDHGMQNK